MLLDDYLNEIKIAIDAVSSLLVNHFREFIDASEGWIEKVAYSYHFQDRANQLLFRYDNAKHKPALDFVEHKHCNDSIIYAPAPYLEQVIQEAIVTQQLI